MEKTFTRVRTTRDIIISLIVFAGGCVLITVPTSAAINVCGFFLLFSGMILYVALHTGYIDEESGIKYRKKEHYFAQSLRDDVTKAISSKPDSLDLSKEDKGNGLRLDIYHCKNDNKVYLQLFEYIPYTYEPCSGVYEYHISEVSKLLK